VSESAAPPLVPDARFPDALAALVDREIAGLDISRPDAGFALERWEQAFVYPLRAGGKRLRPVLCLAVVEALGGDVESALPIAVAIELVHTFSLVHDDLPALDDDSMRRGRPTAHVAFGEDVAVLVGDALLNHAYRLILDAPGVDADRRLRAASLLAEAVDGMIRGQYVDLRPDAVLDAADLRSLDALKTGCLLEVPVRCALALVDADDETIAVYRALAREVGVGFQIVDDLLDATSTSDVLGKTAGADSANAKTTHVTLLGLERTRELAAASEQHAAELLDALPGRPVALAGIVAKIYRRDR
jgi:geranylgeranyl diphosphate synthase type II